MNLKDNELLKSIGIFRYEHSLRVLTTAKKIGLFYNIDQKKIEISALYHDCGKIGNLDKILRLINDYKINLTEEDKKSPAVLHSILGRYIAKIKYNIKDKEILDAIRYHTTGRTNMSNLEKIIFISDYIEPGREFKGVEKVRYLAEKNIDESVIIAMKNTIAFLEKNNKHVHKDTLDGLNYLLKKGVIN